jgi:hypothetical protein
MKGLEKCAVEIEKIVGDVINIGEMVEGVKKFSLLKVIEDVKNIKKELLLTKTDCALSEKV